MAVVIQMGDRELTRLRVMIDLADGRLEFGLDTLEIDVPNLARQADETSRRRSRARKPAL